MNATTTTPPALPHVLRILHALSLCRRARPGDTS